VTQFNLLKGRSRSYIAEKNVFGETFVSWVGCADQFPKAILQFLFNYLSDIQNLHFIFVHLLNQFASADTVHYPGLPFRVLFFVSLGVELVCFFMFAIRTFSQECSIKNLPYTVRSADRSAWSPRS